MVAGYVMESTRLSSALKFFLILAVIILPFELQFSGFCLPRLKWLTNEDYIARATDTVAGSGPDYNSLNEKYWDQFRAFRFVRYIDGDDLKIKNPGCCTVSRQVVNNDWFLRAITGKGKFAAVTVQYDPKFVSPEGKALDIVPTEQSVTSLAKNFKEHLQADNCGYMRREGM